MCLHLSHDAVKLIAAEDIVCYKRVYPSSDLIPEVYLSHGKPFTATIKGIHVKGLVSISHTRFRSRLYLCTNVPQLDGRSCPDKLGFDYSWVFNSYVKDLVIAGKPTDIITTYYTPYQNFRVEIGQTYYSELEVIGNNVEKALHSFEHLDDCKADGGGVYVKCIIPKGSEYYYGLFNDASSYASNALKYLELVK